MKNNLTHHACGDYLILIIQLFFDSVIIQS